MANNFNADRGRCNWVYFDKNYYFYAVKCYRLTNTIKPNQMTTPTTPAVKKDSSILLYLGIASLAVIGIYAISSNQDNSKTTDEEQPQADPLPVNNTTAPVENPNKILSKGVTGIEVEKLQSLMGIPADGIFGSNTESKLFELKRVKQISLNSFKSTPNVAKILPIGSSVMANATTVDIYKAYKKADNSFYTNREIKRTVYYGQKVGFINSNVNNDGLYVVYYKLKESDTLWQVGMVDGRLLMKY